MDDASATPRTALLAGATGLVGHALLPLLLAGKRYRRVHVLLRRAAPNIVAGRKLEVHQVDFARLPAAFPKVDDVFIALGTTIKVAGSQAAFRQVDFDFVVNTARAARAAGAKRLAVVSALGANAKSRVFYNRVKGEMEAAIAQLGYDSVVIAHSWNRATVACRPEPVMPTDCLSGAFIEEPRSRSQDSKIAVRNHANASAIFCIPHVLFQQRPTSSICYRKTA